MYENGRKIYEIVEYFFSGYAPHLQYCVNLEVSIIVSLTTFKDFE